jgi:2,3-dihydroxybenzoate decarboxylase
MCSAEPLACALGALGVDRVMFASDHPFEDAEEAGHFIESVPIADDTRTNIMSKNAIKLLRLN